MTIYDLNVGQKGIVEEIEALDKLTKRLLALGCIKGTVVEVKKIVPLGDPIVIDIRGFNIALRKESAKNIIIKEYLGGKYD